MSLIVVCHECGDRMILSNNGIERMKAECDTVESQKFVCDDCILEFDYVKEEKN